MNANRNQIRDAVIQAVHEFLGPDDVPDVDEQTNPLKDFDKESHDGVDFACILSEVLGIDIPPELNPLVDDARHRARSVGQIVDLMCGLIEKQKEVSHAR